MNRSHRILLAALVMALVTGPPASAENRQSLPAGLRNYHNQTAQRQAQQTSTRRSPHHPGAAHRRSHHDWRRASGCWMPSYGYGVLLPGFAYGYIGSGTYLSLGRGYAATYSNSWLPPLQTPTAWQFGPQPRLGMQPNLLIQQPDLWQQAAALQRNLKEHEIAEKLRTSNAAARQRAERFIEFGDNLFGQQRYHEAVQRYKSAIEAAPDVSTAYYRNAYALIAVKQYELAAKSFRIVAQLDPDLARRPFDLVGLYGDHRIAMMAHLETLAEAAEDHPDDAGLLFLVGTFLRDDGQPQRAQAFFQRAAGLDPDLQQLVQAFAAEAPAADDERPVLVGQEREI